MNDNFFDIVFDIIKNVDTYDFQKEEIFMKYYLIHLTEKNFKECIISMFLESSEFNKQIVEFSSKFKK